MPGILSLVKLSLIVLLPLWLMHTKRHTALLIWIGATLGTDVLNVNIFANITPLSAVGLLYLPTAILLLPQVLSTGVGKLAWLSFSLLVALGIVYGFVFPWPDTTGARGLNQLPQGRSTIYLVRTATEFSVAFYLAARVRDPVNIRTFLIGLLVGTTIASTGVLLQWVTDRDIYRLLVPAARDLSGIGRLRGLNDEPRFSGNIIALGLILLLGLRHVHYRIPLFLVHAAAFAFTVSTSALVTLALGIALLTTIAGANRARILALLTLLAVLGSPVLFARRHILESWRTNVGARLGSAPETGRPPANLGEMVAGRLEVFDASAVLYLSAHPRHLLFGAGPGLITLPASEYVPEGIGRAIYGNRIDTPPSMGFFLLLANSGFVGLSLWLLTTLACYRALHRAATLASSIDRHRWKDALTFFIVISGLYLIQARPVWYLFLGVGLGAASVVRQARRKPTGQAELPSAASIRHQSAQP